MMNLQKKALFPFLYGGGANGARWVFLSLARSDAQEIQFLPVFLHRIYSFFSRFYIKFTSISNNTIHSAHNKGYYLIISNCPSHEKIDFQSANLT